MSRSASIRLSYLLWLTLAIWVVHPTAARAQEPTPIRRDMLVDGVLNRGDATLGSGEYFRVYSYQRAETAPAILQVDLTSRDFDPYLIVLPPGGTTQADDDDGLGNRNSRVSIRVSDSGTFRIVVTTYDLGETGRFRLRLRELPADTTVPTGIASLTAGGGPLGSVIPVLPRQQCQFSLDSTRSQNRDIDLSHPKHYVRITERTNTGQQYVLYSDTGGVHLREVDLESHVIIEFNRKWVREVARNFDAAITVSAELNGQPVQVPGYSKIGEKRRVASVLIGSSHRARQTMCGVISEWRAVSSLLDTPVTPEVLDRNRALLRNAAPTIIVTLRAIRSLRDRRLLQHVTRGTPIDPAVFVTLADQADSLIDAATDATTGDTSALQVFRDLSLTMERLTDLAEELGGKLEVSLDELIADLVSQLRDTELLLPSLNARPGDRLRIRIANDADADSLPRELEIELKVVDYGLSPGLTESFMFLRRLGVADPDVMTGGAVPAMAAESPSPDTLPLPSNFAPAPGTTFGFRWYPRGSSWAADVVRFLKPRFAVNVSFLRFGDRVIGISERVEMTDAGGTPTTNVEREVTIEDRIAVFNVGIGPALSFFDDVLQVTYGWNLMVDDKRRYWGIGVSFVTFVRKVRSVASSEQ